MHKGKNVLQQRTEAQIHFFLTAWLYLRKHYTN